uniref:Uncharacterized protein n=1 Tax=Ceratitis capitata TaxID=7213 RepID=W8CD79_CERCA
MLSSPGHSTCSQHLCQSPNLLKQSASVDNAGWHAASTSENSDNGSVGFTEDFYQHDDPIDLFNIFENFSSDFMPSPTFNDTWSDLLEEDFGNKDLTQLTTVGAEHSYAGKEQLPTSTSTDDDAGICLHIRQGKVSLEFCPTCSWNSNNYTNVDLLQN